MSRFSLHVLARRLIVLSALVSPLAWAGIKDVEPNNSCAAPQNLGQTSKVKLSGTIDASDVDFYTLTAKPGQLLQIDMRGAPSGAGTLGNMLMGLLDADCSVVQYSDNSENGLEARLVFMAPADGVVRIAAAGDPDFGFTGANTSTGTYKLTIGPPTVPVIAFSGNLTDAVTGLPLTKADFAVVNLMSCPSADYQICTTYSAQGIPDANGHYAIAQALPPGVYQIRVLADNHASKNLAPVTVTGFEGKSTKNYALAPLPMVVSDMTPCQTIAAGGSCKYSYVLSNTTSKTLKTSVWSQTEQGPNGSPMFRTNYTMGKSTSAPMAIKLAPGESKKVTQSMSLSDMLSGSTGALYVYASTADDQTNTIGYGYGFNYTVTAADKAVSTVRSAQAMKPLMARQLQATARSGPAASAASDVISGVALDPVTNQPITDGSVAVQLQGCQDPSLDLCMGTKALFTVDANGKYSYNARRLAPGHYQLWAFRQDGTTYGLNYSQAFDYAGGAATVDITAAKAPVKYGPVTACAGADALPVGTPCKATYDLTNVTSAPLTVDLWAVVSTYETGSVQGYSQYSVGVDGSSTLSSVTIAPGATLTVSHSLPLAKQLPSGTYASTEFFASVPGKQAMTLGNASGFYVNIVP
ncbi:hypothetical protein LRH25_28840 [Ideonella azotifigens]|uniref:Carboxypeptidase regulatory-like domain-containing protein n=1 Tax=Ideonella azotifigens TaxID=513160 RepID=A0ABP3VE52_9BURK|nr:hypothetical protein [Ideonella azotifigens]MCD2344335.1 hypothetical protein [Ideonella azotifigens]